jgi:hypothetical protein
MTVRPSELTVAISAAASSVTPVLRYAGTVAIRPNGPGPSEPCADAGTLGSIDATSTPAASGPMCLRFIHCAYSARLSG